MKFLATLLVAVPFLAELASASLNCTVTEDLPYYTCPDDKCSKAGTYKVGEMAMFGCAADNTVAPNRWLYNWNTYYTKSTTKIKDCKFNGMPFQNTDVLPFCKDDPYVPTPKPCVCQPNSTLV